MNEFDKVYNVIKESFNTAYSKREILTGTITFKTINVGSKSEHDAPFIITKDGDEIAVFKKGDNPFENNSLKEFEGKAVKITGTNKGNRFTIESIKEVGSDQGRSAKNYCEECGHKMYDPDSKYCENCGAKL